MKQTIEKNLTEAIGKMIPEDMYERIKKKLEVSDSVETIEKINNRKKMNYLRSTKYLLAAACLLLVIGLGGNSYYTRNFVIDSVIDIDVNPSIELTTNKKDIVMKANAINSEGAEVLNDMDLEGVDLDVAVNAIIGAMLQKGYFTGVENYILVSVQNEDNKKAEDIKQSIVTNINATLDSGNFTASLIDQIIEMDEAIEAFAKAYGISVGKSAFIWNLAQEDPTLNIEELAQYSISEIMELINHRVESQEDVVVSNNVKNNDLEGDNRDDDKDSEDDNRDNDKDSKKDNRDDDKDSGDDDRDDDKDSKKDNRDDDKDSGDDDRDDDKDSKKDNQDDDKDSGDDDKDSGDKDDVEDDDDDSEDDDDDSEEDD